MIIVALGIMLDAAKPRMYCPDARVSERPRRDLWAVIQRNERSQSTVHNLPFRVRERHRRCVVRRSAPSFSPLRVA
jgi:hypothetical protein